MPCGSDGVYMDKRNWIKSWENHNVVILDPFSSKKKEPREPAFHFSIDHTQTKPD